MVVSASNPVVMDLAMQAPNGIPMYVHVAGITADSDGWFYKPGQLVIITAAKTVSKHTAGLTPFGIIKVGIHNVDAPEGLTATMMVQVKPFRFSTMVVNMTSSAAIDAGDEIVTSGTAMKVCKATDLAGLAATGAQTASAVDATRPTVAITGSIPEYTIIGIALTATSGDAQTVEVLV